MAKKKTKAATKKAPAKKAAQKKAASKGKSPGAPKRAKKSGARATKPAPARTGSGGGATLPFFQVDAFTGRLFHGNPAGVVLLDEWLPDETMQTIASENNLSETAFVVPSSGKSPSGTTRMGIRWFTPAVEVDLCGHATLASAHVLWEHVGLSARTLVFDSASGDLPATREDGLIVLDFPARQGERVNAARDLARALGREPVEVFRSNMMLAVFDSKKDIHEMEPDFDAVARFDALGVIVTAPGAGHDFVSRFFAPAAGIDEDPVTGAAHCMLAPYWAQRLGRTRLTARQVSPRGGEMSCEVVGDRVRMGGRAVTYLDGRIRV